MTTTPCPDCGKNIVVCRRYSLEPFADYLRTTVSDAGHRFGISGTTLRDARCHGLTRRVVDRLADELCEHPAVIWPEVIDHDIEDHSRKCEECGELFLVRTHGGGRPQRFCSAACKSRKWMRDTYERRDEASRRAARYQSDPEYRDRRIREARWYRRAKQRRDEGEAA